MTSQTKKFIEVSDVIGIRLECKKCGCALMIDMNRKDGTVENLLNPANTIMAKCPACGAVWAALPDGRLAFDTEVKDMLRRMEQVKQIESRFGFLLRLEIKDEKAVGQ